MGGCGCNKGREIHHMGSYGYVHYRWQGQGAIRVRGGTTGQMYRFSGYGSVVSIDERDRGTVSRIQGMVSVG